MEKSYDQLIYDTAISQGFTPTAAKLVVAQSRLETANYTSAVFKLNNNTGGMKFVGQKNATRGSLAPSSERSYSCKSGGACSNSDHYAKFSSVADSAADVIVRLYNKTMGGVTPDQLKNAKTPEEFARLLKKRKYYGFGAYGTPQAEKEIAGYGAGLKALVLRVEVIEFLKKNKNQLLIGLGLIALGAAYYLYTKK